MGLDVQASRLFADAWLTVSDARVPEARDAIEVGEALFDTVSAGALAGNAPSRHHCETDAFVQETLGDINPDNSRSCWVH